MIAPAADNHHSSFQSPIPNDEDDVAFIHHKDSGAKANAARGMTHSHHVSASNLPLHHLPASNGPLHHIAFKTQAIKGYAPIPASINNNDGRPAAAQQHRQMDKAPHANTHKLRHSRLRPSGTDISMHQDISNPHPEFMYTSEETHDMGQLLPIHYKSPSIRSKSRTSSCSLSIAGKTPIMNTAPLAHSTYHQPEQMKQMENYQYHDGSGQTLKASHSLGIVADMSDLPSLTSTANHLSNLKSTNSTHFDQPKSMWNMFTSTSQKVFEGMEFVGEKLADALGITGPRYAMYMDASELQNDEENGPNELATTYSGQDPMMFHESNESYP